MTDIVFKTRVSVEEVEEGVTCQPKFDSDGLIPVITIEFETNEVLMHGYSNDAALRLTMSTKKAHYFSRSRQRIWKKGEKSGGDKGDEGSGNEEEVPFSSAAAAVMTPKSGKRDTPKID